MLKVIYIADKEPIPKLKKLSPKQQLHGDALAAAASWRAKERPKAIAFFAKEHTALDALIKKYNI